MKVVEQNIVNSYLIIEEELFIISPSDYVPTEVPLLFSEEMVAYLEYALDLMYMRYESRLANM